MKLRRRTSLAVMTAVVSVSAALGLAGSASSSATVSACSQKPLCASITTQDFASRSPSGSPHYLSDSVSISYDTSKGSTSNLVNINVVLTWADLGSASTTSTYVPSASDPRCVPGTGFTVVCTAPKSLRAGDPAVNFSPLVFQTAADAQTSPASDTQVTVQATAKEQITGKGGSPNEAVVVLSGKTSYEGDADRDISIAGGSIPTVTLATLPAGHQIAKVPIPATADRRLYEVVEQDYSSTVPCPTTVKRCFGQYVTTTAPGLSPVNVRMTYEGPRPSGVSESSIVVLHTRADSTLVTISTRCSGALFSGEPPASEISPNGCRRVAITPISGGDVRIDIDAWDVTNGGWGGAG
jgi:hypothetical protein